MSSCTKSSIELNSPLCHDDEADDNDDNDDDMKNKIKRLDHFCNDRLPQTIFPAAIICLHGNLENC